jgi:hypothetical protein
MRLVLRIFLLFFLVSVAGKIAAQDIAVDTIVEEVNEGIVAPPAEATEDEESDDETAHTYERRHMDEGRLQSLRSRREFKYPDLENDTLEVKHDPPPESRFEGIDVSVFLWLIVAIGAVIVVLQLSGVNMRQLFSPSRLDKRDEPDELSENIHDIPFEKAISNAINAGNYALATRLMYLQGLKLLSDKNLISWHENKTNWQYVYELKDTRLRSSFRTVTSIFEYVQYGNMRVEKEKFASVQEAFQNFKMQVV